jgi:hypothetical protein
MTLRAIDPTQYEWRREVPQGDVGAVPLLQWIPIAKMRVDGSYQRSIHDRGARNVRAIAMNFDWSKFAPVIAAPIEGGLFAIIDGQHRTTAAAARGIKEVPCQVVIADRAKQADAFAAINGNVTAITPMQMHAARLAAGDAQAQQLTVVCSNAGVNICRYPVPANKMKIGDTLAAGQLHKLLGRFGPEVLTTALRCITRTRKGNIGMVRAPVIQALCFVFDAQPEVLQDEKKLIFAMQTFDFAAQWEAAGKRIVSERCGMASILIELIAEHLDKRMGAGAA